MPLMDRETHENLLNELLNPELEQSRRTEILQELRTDHNTGRNEAVEYEEKTKKLQKNNDDLIISNSQLFRKLGTTQADPKEKEQEEKKEFSQKVDLNYIETYDPDASN